jgi:hypothetical protein
MLTTLKDCTNSVLIKGLVSPQNLKYLDKEGGKPEILGFNDTGKAISFLGLNSEEDGRGE